MSSSEPHKPSIFLSYSWEDFVIASKIEEDFKNAGLNIVRDIRMDYKDDIPKFMKRISKEDYAILLISTAYLKSANCMKEVLELLEDREYEKKILPIILPTTNIFKSEGVLDLVKFWENKINELNNKTKELVNLANIPGIIEDINLFIKIRNSIDGFASKIKTLNCKSFSELSESNYKPILDFIGVVQEDLEALILNIIKLQNLEQREIEIDKLLEKYPNKGSLLFLKANTALSEKKLQKAQNIFLQLIKRNPETIELYNNLGICYKNQGLFKEALDSFRKAISINPKSGTAYNNLGLIFKENLNNNEEALKNYELSIKLDPSSGEAHYNFALLLDDTKDYINSKYHYEEALKIYPSLSSPERIASVHFGYANLLFLKLNDFYNAKIQYEYCLSIDQRHYKAHCNFAVLLKRAFHDYTKSCFHYERALEIEPRDRISHNNLGNLYSEHLSNSELARFHYQKAIEIDENYAEAYVGLGNLLMEVAPGKAKSLYEKALSLNPFLTKAKINYDKVVKKLDLLQ